MPSENPAIASRRATARAALLNPPPPLQKEVEYGGEKLLIVSPTLAQRAHIQAQSVKFDAGGSPQVNVVAQRVAAMIAMVFVRGEDGRPLAAAFEANDREALLATPAVPGNVVDELGTAAVEFLQKAESVEPGKNG